jgi:hypothetical protein
MGGAADWRRIHARDPWPKSPADFALGIAQYFDSRGLFTQWYWPEGSRGKLWNFLHGNGWRVT